MQKDRSLLPALKEMERYFGIFNKALYKGKLTRPIITIQSAGRKNMLGWFWADTWHSDGTKKKNKHPEINITAEHLSRGPLDVLETLIHEMVHLDNWSKDVQDCSASQYHNKAFKAGCDRIGLVCEQGKKHGWAHTSLSPELKKLIVAHKPAKVAFSMFRAVESSAKSGPGSRMIKWSCGCTNIRVAVADFDATCNSCGGDFIEVD